MTNRTVAPGLHHHAHSVLGALPPVPVTLFVVVGVALIVAVSAWVLVLHLLTGTVYIHRAPGAGEWADAAPEAAEVLR